MSTLEGKTLDWKVPPVMGRSLHPGQLSVSLCAMSGLVPQISQFVTDREPTFGEDMPRGVGKAGRGSCGHPRCMKLSSGKVSGHNPLLP